MRMDDFLMGNAIKNRKVTQIHSALITGVSGFVGSHLVHFLELQGWKVYGFDKHSGGGQKNVFVGDIGNRNDFGIALQECHPQIIVHLAGLIKSTQPEELYRTNLLGTVTLFESLVESGQRPTVIISSSSAVYGSGFGGRPITERFRTRPVTHHAVSKLAEESVALRYFDAYRLPVLIVRMFNLIGPGESPSLACSAFARQIALAEVTGNNEIQTGNLGSCRDFVDVRDAVRAFALVAEKGRVGQIYNVCSGRAVSIRKCLDEMLSMSARQFNVRVDPDLVQKNDIPVQVGSARKLNQATGWRPQLSLKRSLSDLLTYWRQRVKLELE